MRTRSSALRAVDLRLLYLILWLSGTSFLSLSCFLAALSSSASVSTSLYSAQFLAALITVAASSGAYDYYSAVGYNDGFINSTVCYLVSSSFNRIYSSMLIGNEFVQFLVFFLPWFHAAQAMADVISVVQYEGQSIGMGDIGKDVTLSFTAAEDQLFTCPWLKTPITMLITSSILYVFYLTFFLFPFLFLFYFYLCSYMFMSWLTAQIITSDGTEGRSLANILIPPALRRLLFREREEVQDGDIRGSERQLSANEGSVRAYKVSKTFSGMMLVLSSCFDSSLSNIKRELIL